MTDAERLAHAVLIFHQGGAWTQDHHAYWVAVTGAHAVTTRTLGDLARRVLATGEKDRDVPPSLRLVGDATPDDENRHGRRKQSP